MKARGVRRLRGLEEQVARAEERAAQAAAEAARLEALVQARRRELLELQQSRARERRLVAVGQLAAGVMHDVNNALNPIMSAAFLLQRHADDPDAVRAYADRIAKAADAGASAAARVGRFIRQEEDAGDERLDPVDLSAVVDDVVAITRPGWAERARGAAITLDRRVQDGVTSRGVPGELRGAVLNLVQNAIDAMRDTGGTLGVATGMDAETAWIEVRDTGAGMSDEVRARVFEPFFTTKGADGTGLGLCEARAAVRRHGGDMQLASTPGIGTTARITLPLGPAPDDAPAESHLVAGRRVLYVEDQHEGAAVVRELLAREGCTVDHAPDASTALTLLGCDASSDESGAMPYDVLVADLGDAGGWALIAAARARWRALRIGVVTGWELQARVGDAHAVNFMLRKPLRARDLLAYVAADT